MDLKALGSGSRSLAKYVDRGAKAAKKLTISSRKPSRVRGLVKHPVRSAKRYFGLGRYNLNPKVTFTREGVKISRAPRIAKRRAAAANSLKKHVKSGQVGFITSPTPRYKKVLAMEERLPKVYRRRRRVVVGGTIGAVLGARIYQVQRRQKSKSRKRGR